MAWTSSLRHNGQDGVATCVQRSKQDLQPKYWLQQAVITTAVFTGKFYIQGER